MNPLFILYIAGGVVIFIAPFILFSFVFLHPKYDKKQSEFGLGEPMENPTPYLSSFEVKREKSRALLCLKLTKPSSFKTIVFNKKGKPCKVIAVDCLDSSRPCWLSLPKGATGIAFVERTPGKKINFDMEPWKVFVLPLIYAIAGAIGVFLVVFGLCWIGYSLRIMPPNFHYPYPNMITYLGTIGAGVVFYLATLGCFFARYVHFSKKEGK